MEIVVWSNGFGLPSFDSTSLNVIAFCKFQDIPTNITISKNPWRSPTYDLPFLKDKNGKKVGGLHDIFDHCLGTSGKNLIAKTSYIAFEAWIEEKLKPAIEHYVWVDELNFTSFTRPWYARKTVFPLSMYIPFSKNGAIINKLYYLFSDKIPEKSKEYRMYKDAKDCIKSLSLLLDEKEYFDGTSPAATDALVFSCLAPLIKAPFPNRSLQQHVKGFPNLVNYCNRVLENYFPVDPEQEEVEKSEAKDQAAKSENELEYPNRMRNGLLTGILTLSSMSAYAYWHRLLYFKKPKYLR